MKPNINVLPDWGNSPKAAFIKDLNIAFLNGDLDFLREAFTDDIVWIIAGDKTIEGLEAMRNELQQVSEFKAVDLSIQSIVTHGREAAAQGEMTMTDGTRYSFGDFYQFASAGSKKISRMTSIVVKLAAP